jgi:hypothetical protein
MAIWLTVAAAFLSGDSALAADAQDEWKKTIEAAKKEGKLVAGGPPTDVLRKKYKETFEKQFGIELELLSALGPQNASRAMAEFKAGVRYFDVLLREGCHDAGTVREDSFLRRGYHYRMARPGRGVREKNS